MLRYLDVDVALIPCGVHFFTDLLLSDFPPFIAEWSNGRGG